MTLKKTPVIITGVFYKKRKKDIKIKPTAFNTARTIIN